MVFQYTLLSGALGLFIVLTIFFLLTERVRGDNQRHCEEEKGECILNVNVCLPLLNHTKWVRCTINRSHSTPCKKAEFEHLQIFPGHCLDFFLSVSGKICHSPIKKVKKQPTLIISFSQHSPFLRNSKKIRAEIRPGSYLTWGVRRGVCDKIVHTKMHFSASA